MQQGSKSPRTSRRTTRRTTRRATRRATRSTLSAVVGGIALVVPLVLVPALPAQAAHYIASEPRVEILSINDKWQAQVTIASVWKFGPSFSLSLLNPAGTGTGITHVRTVDTGTAADKTDVYLFDLTSLTTSNAATGLYVVRWSTCCKIDFYNTGQDSMGFEAGFWFDPSQPDPATSGNFGSPRFTAALITNVAGGSEFSQNLGGVSPNGNTLAYSLNENRTVVPFGAPVTKSGSTTHGGRSWWTYAGAAKYEDEDTDSRLVFLSASGQLTIPSAVTTAIAA